MDKLVQELAVSINCKKGSSFGKKRKSTTYISQALSCQPGISEFIISNIEALRFLYPLSELIQAVVDASR